MSIITFVVNPKAQAGRVAKKWSQLSQTIKDIFGNYHVEFTTKPQDATRIAEKIASSTGGLIVAVGGDGTINETVNGLFKDGQLINPDVTFAVLPLGTGGDFVRTIKISHNPKQALLQIKNAHCILTDVGHVTLNDFNKQKRERYFINLLTLGLGGLTSYIVNQESKSLGGKLSFIKGAWKAICQYQPRPITITNENDTTLFSDNIHLLAIGKGRYCGGGMFMAPNASLENGLLNVIAVPKLTKRKLLCNFPKLYQGKHLEDPIVKTFNCRTIRISTDASDMFVDVDGESPGTLPVIVSCFPKALKLIVGEDYQASI